jgi:hypothetical protein
MQLKLWQVDAFAAVPLEGNPAAIIPLENWLDDSLMQRIANENYLAETAFFVRLAEGNTSCAGARRKRKSSCADMRPWPARGCCSKSLRLS